MKKCNNCENCCPVNALPELLIPPELFEAAGIPFGVSLEVTCGDGEIVIRAAEDDILNAVPPDLMNLFLNYGINPDTVRSVLKEGAFNG